MSKVDKKLLIANNSIRIDSLKLRIPLSLVTIKDTSVIEHEGKFTVETGEVPPQDFKRKSKEYNFSNSSTVKFLIEKRVVTHWLNALPQEVFVILLNSKILRENYFEGIHFDRSKQIYNDLMSLNVFEVEYETFMQSHVTDVDLKFDEVMSQDSWNDVMNCFENETKPSKLMGKGYRRFKPTKKFPYQNGLQYSTRAKATKYKPFFKLYWKGGELLSNSTDFYKEHLAKEYDENTIKKIVRIETTIKNKDHAKKLGIDNFTLLGLMSLTEGQKEYAFRNIVQTYLNGNKLLKHIEPTNKDEMNPTEKILYFYMVQVMQDNPDKLPETIIESSIQAIESKQTRWRKKKELLALYERRIKGNKVDISNKDIHSFLRKFGWG